MEVSRYLINKVNLDGGWGLDTESPSTVLGTALNYTTLRILGMKKEHPIAVDARRCLHALGGSAGIPQWGKMWFAVMNLYSWEGINPLLPEIWYAPPSLQFPTPVARVDNSVQGFAGLATYTPD